MCIPLLDFLNPITTIFARCILLDQVDTLTVKGDRDLQFKYKNQSISVEIGDSLQFEIDGRSEIKSIVDSFCSICLQELLKSGHFSHIRSKKSILVFFNELVDIFTKNSCVIADFFVELRSLMINQSKMEYCDIEHSKLHRLVLKFTKNNLGLSCFPTLYHIFVNKLILFLNSNLHNELIDNFLNNYGLN